MISVTGLSKRYGTHLAVDDVSFNIKKGEIIGFLGPNGAGKSTIMNILTGYLSLTQGDVKIDGFDIMENPEQAKRRIGYLPEIPPLYLDMTVMEYLGFIYDILGIHQNGYPYDIITCDGFSISPEMFGKISHEIMDLLNSFESSFQLSLSDDTDYSEMKENSWRLERQSMPNDARSVPFLMPVFYLDAKKEKELIDSSWPEIRNRLIKCGAYSKLLDES